MTASAAGTVEEPGHNVAQKSGLNRAILDQAWGKFFQRLEWKCEQRGAQVIKVSPQNADVVGARNIKVRGQRMSACGELGEVGRAQVNRRMETVHGAGQQQEPIEVISGVSH